MNPALYCVILGKYLTSLSLSFLIGKMEVMIPPGRDENERRQCLASAGRALAPGTQSALIINNHY